MRFSILSAVFLCLAAANGGNAAESVPLGGFIPFVGFGMTNEAKTLDELDLGGIPFITDPETSVGASQLLRAGGAADPYFDIALFDSGAATHIITQQAFNGLDIDGNGMRGTNTQIIGGATGQILLEINDAGGIYIDGMSGRTATGSTLGMNVANLRGQSSFATLTAPQEWTLPNIIGLPIAAQHTVAIRNDLPQVFTHQNRTVRTPDVQLTDLGTGNQQGITRRMPLKLHPGIGFVQGPQFVFNLDLDSILGGSGDLDIANNPASPSVILDSNGNGGGLFIDVNMARGNRSFFEREFLFDTGADLTVVSEQSAVRLGFDPILDTPDFILQVEGSGGVQGGVPGFYVEELSLDSIGGSFVARNVPVAVLDVTNPNDPGNIIDGILGTHLFNDRNLVIDANPSTGQGGVGPSLYISDPITTQQSWVATAATAQWSTGTNWQTTAKPGQLDAVTIQSNTGGPQTARVTSAEQVFSLIVGGDSPGVVTVDIDGGSLTVFSDTVIKDGGRIEVGSQMDAPSINIEGGELTGGGDIFVGNGPITGAVRNLGGRVDPDGLLSITGDLANLSEGTIAFEIGNTSDSIDATRFAFLDGILEVTLANGFTPNVNDSFTLITTGEDLLGQFSTLNLPGGFEWDVDYSGGSVVLEVTSLLAALPGDFNTDGVVDAVDYAVWREGLGTIYTQQHYTDWRNNYGASQGPSNITSAPAPSASALLLLGCVPFLRRRR